MNQDDVVLNTWLMDRMPDAYVDDEGDVVAKREGQKVQEGEIVGSTYELNFTKLFRTGPRRTRNLEILLIEAELYDETGETGNAAIPIGEEFQQEAREHIESRGLVPAWEAGR